LASIALAETLRRIIALPYLFTPQQALARLREGEQYAREAVRIFDEEINEPMRLAEALLEQGCTYREMARLGIRHKLVSGRTWEGWAHAGEQALRRAVGEAGEQFAYRKVDALVNLAWLRYYIGDPQGAQRVLHGDEEHRSEVLAAIPEEYLIVRSKGIRPVTDPVGWFWVQLGKADLLLGLIAYDEYKELDHAIKGLKPEERKEAWGPLEQTGRLWTLSLAYNARYGESFRDLKAGQRLIYEHLAGLNKYEMQVIRNSIAKTIQEYAIPPELCSMEQFVNKRFGPPLTNENGA
jgi:hypothetical protein